MIAVLIFILSLSIDSILLNETINDLWALQIIDGEISFSKSLNVCSVTIGIIVANTPQPKTLFTRIYV
jgi:hypothetical protein